MPLIVRPASGNVRKQSWPVGDGDMKMQQEQLDLTLGLTVRYPKLRDVLTAVVYGSRSGLHGVAADIDRSPSELSRMLNRDQDDPRKLDVEDLCGIIASTGDMRPIQWLTEKYAGDPAARQAQATQQLAQLMPAIAELLTQAGVPAKGARR